MRQHAASTHVNLVSQNVSRLCYSSTQGALCWVLHMWGPLHHLPFEYISHVSPTIVIGPSDSPDLDNNLVYSMLFFFGIEQIDIPAWLVYAFISSCVCNGAKCIFTH
jgi:hypothetical protein